MKVRFFENFKVRMLMYTLISMGVALLASTLVLFLCIRSHWLVRYYNNGEAGNQIVTENAGNQLTESSGQLAESSGQLAESGGQLTDSAKSMLGHSNVLYRIFGVGIKPELLLLVSLIAIIVFLIVFFLLTRRMTVYIDNILQKARQMADGDFEQRIEVRHQDEFSCIADSINRMMDTVQEMQAKEQAAEDSKNEMITNVAHDLRTPLTSIIGYIDILNTRQDLSKEQQAEYLKIAWEKARKLESLINELFSFTKVSGGGPPMKMATIDLIKLLEQEVDELYPAFEENGLSCVFEPDVDSCQIQADGEQLVRVFDNLLGNAIRYGKDGKIIRVRTRTGGGCIRVQAINYGSLIPEDSIPHLFEKFYKVDTSRQSSGEGTGLGLAIAKSIVESHGGSIRASSSFEGTVFEVTLPIDSASGGKLAESTGLTTG